MTNDNATPRPKDAWYLFGRKIAALGFIVVILAGNFWWVEYALLQKVHDFVEWSFFIGLLIAIAGGVIIVLRKFVLFIKDNYL